jgi:hypothetical protein
VTFREDRARKRARRVRAMHERYSEGLTPAEVGAEFGVTKERMRQLFVDQRLPTRDRGRRAGSGPGHHRPEDMPGDPLLGRQRNDRTSYGGDSRDAD